MKYKRLLYLLLAVVMILGMLSGCGNNQAEQTNSTQNENFTTENKLEIINELDLSDLWKQELCHAAQLGMPMGKVQQDTISGKEMMIYLPKPPGRHRSMRCRSSFAREMQYFSIVVIRGQSKPVMNPDLLHLRL